MSVQAGQMDKIVSQLSNMVGGTADSGAKAAGLSVSDQHFHHIATGATSTSQVKAESVIPLDDSSDFNDFNN